MDGVDDMDGYFLYFTFSFLTLWISAVFRCTFRCTSFWRQLSFLCTNYHKPTSLR